MRTNSLTCLLFGVALLFAHRAAGSVGADVPKFSDYRTGPVYAGAPAEVKIAGDDERSYRTRLRDASRQPANFAAEYVMAVWGCGAGCVTGAAVSLRTGRVTFFPGTVCCWRGDGEMLAFRADSRLLVAAGVVDERGEYGAHFYEFTGKAFKLVRTIPVKDESSTDGEAP